MEFKMRANIVMSKELTIEAKDWFEAMQMAEDMIKNEEIPFEEFMPTKLHFEEITPIKWMSDEKYKKLCATRR